MKTPLSFKAKTAFIALFAVALIGGTGGVVAAQSADDMMKQPPDQRAMMMLSDGKAAMDDKVMDDPLMVKQRFDQQVRSYLNQAYADMGETDKRPLYDFFDSYNAAWLSFEKDMAAAKEQAGMDGMDRQGDEARNRFTDAYNRASADFMNDMETAKNKLAGDMDKAGMAEAKDDFMNRYNQAKAMYGQHMTTLRDELYDQM